MEQRSADLRVKRPICLALGRSTTLAAGNFNGRIPFPLLLLLRDEKRGLWSYLRPVKSGGRSGTRPEILCKAQKDGRFIRNVPLIVVQLLHKLIWTNCKGENPEGRSNVV